MASVVGGILLAGITLYAVLAGADFGGGLWDLLAGGDQRGREPRRLIDESITPVWEANHVWLIFDLVIFWTAFPDAFASVVTTAAVPLWLAVAGIVLRGAGFAFRKEITRPSLVRATGATFALSSLVTPFFMGTVIGAMATGKIPADARHANLDAWTNPTSLLAGFLFVAACGYLAAVYLTGEASHRRVPALATYFSRRAQASAVVSGVLSLALLAVLHGSNRELFGRLTGRALPLVIVAGLSGLAVAAVMSTKWLSRWQARMVAATGVAFVIWGWGVAQYPTLLPGTAITLTNAGAPHATFVALVAVFVAAALLVGPSLVLLYTFQNRQLLDADGEETGTEPVGPAPSPGDAP
jgi:cytochrome d ubiquinol oxidase subunit II